MESKNKKAIDIVKEKQVGIRWLKYFDTAEEYNKGLPDEYCLTEDEFKLLKEVYCNA